MLTKTFILTTTFLLLCLFSFSQQENWDVYLARYDKGVGSTMLDMSLKKRAPLKEFPFLLTTGVTIKNCQASGLPEANEFEALYKISDKIKAVIDSVSKNTSTATFSYQCERIDYYYLSDTSNIRRVLEAMYKINYPNYTFSINLRRDAKWEAYLTFLYPNEETQEYMSNQKVILNLTKEGDKLTQPRQVDHWLYFADEAGRNKFIAYATKQHFTISGVKIVKNTSQPFQLQISRTDKVDLESISKLTIQLKEKAKEFNGDYDGWETIVIK